MARSWTRDTAAAPGNITLPDGAVLRLDRPSTGAIPHVFADIFGAGAEQRRLIEPRQSVRVGDHLFVITALDDQTVEYRISHVHDDHQPLLRRLAQGLRPTIAPA